MILVDEDTNSILTDDIKFSAGFGHEHEGGASSIFFHAPPSPGGTFFCIPNICPWGNQEFNQVDPGGAESYEYRDEGGGDQGEEETKEKANDVDDGDRLVGGEAINHRSTRVSEGGKLCSGDFHSWSTGSCLAGVLVRDLQFLTIMFMVQLCLIDSEKSVLVHK